MSYSYVPIYGVITWTDGDLPSYCAFLTGTQELMSIACGQNYSGIVFNLRKSFGEIDLGNEFSLNGFNI